MVVLHAEAFLLLVTTVAERAGARVDPLILSKASPETGAEQVQCCHLVSWRSLRVEPDKHGCLPGYHHANEATSCNFVEQRCGPVTSLRRLPEALR